MVFITFLLPISQNTNYKIGNHSVSSNHYVQESYKLFTHFSNVRRDKFVVPSFRSIAQVLSSSLIHLAQFKVF